MERKVSGTLVGRVLAKAYNVTSCLDALLQGHRKSDVYYIRPDDTGPVMTVYCDQMAHGGGWTVFQRRINSTVDFNKTWSAFQNGFGALEGEFWLGNDNIHLLTSSPVQLLVEMKKFNGDYYYAEYDSFMIASEQEKYVIKVSDYSGTAGDSLSYHDGAAFSTKDRNNSPGSVNCSADYSSAWWYKHCKESNEKYGPTDSGTLSSGIKWEALLGQLDNLKSVEMKIRPKEGSSLKCYDWGCFYVIKKTSLVNFNAANQGCLSMGAQLATIMNQTENADVNNMMREAGIPKAYIGFNDLVEEGKSQWIDGSTSEYTNWQGNTNAGRVCVVMLANGLWDPVSCGWKYPGYVCRRALMCFKGSCYKPSRSNELDTMSNTQSMCTLFGMELIKVHHADENYFVSNHVMQTPGQDVWIGLNDQINEGSFLWPDNSSLLQSSAASWDVQQPNNQNEDKDCVTLGPNKLWKTKPCLQTAGEICQKQVAQSCSELLELGERKSGIYYITTSTSQSDLKPIKVWCDQDDDDGGWEVLLRRQDGSVTFHDKLWNDYENGFGDPEKEFWLGLKYIAKFRHREIMLKIKNAAGESKYILYGGLHVYEAKYKYQLSINRFRRGTLHEYFGRGNGMKFSTLDQDNDYVTDKSCSELLGSPGWLYTRRHPHKDCFNKSENIFGPYSPATIGDERNLYHSGFNSPITYVELKMRYIKGYQKSVFGTFYPMEGYPYEGLSLLYTPHQFTFHAITNTKAWYLSITPRSDWTYYTFSWSEHHGVRSYENGILVSQSKIFRNVSGSNRGYFLYNIADVYLQHVLYIFLTRMKVWDRDLTNDQVKVDYNDAYFTLDGHTTHWDPAKSNQFNWTLNSNCTDSADTGPCTDHTFKKTQGSYLYLEASFPRRFADASSLQSQVFFPHHHKCFSFWYHMNGDSMGSLGVSINVFNRRTYELTIFNEQRVLWENSGNRGNQWRFAMIKIKETKLFTLLITGVVGQTYLSDIAIDDLSVTVSPCPANFTSCNPKCREGFSCVEEKGYCDCKDFKHVDGLCNDVLHKSIFVDVAHYWPLDYAITVTNLHGDAHGSTVGDVTAVPGPVNHALQTHGTTGQITLGDLRGSCIFSSPSCPDGLTVRFWLKFSENSEKQKRVYLSLGNKMGHSRGIQVLQDYSVIDHPAHLIINATIDQMSCVMVFEVHDSIWSIIAVTWSKVIGFTVYHNRLAVTTFLLRQCTFVASVSPSNTEFRTGLQTSSMSLDDVTIWYKELPQPQIVKMFRFFTAPQNTLVLNVKFEDEVFAEKLQDRESQEFRDFHAKLLGNARAVFTGKSADNFDGIYINQLSNGSVIARLTFVFHEISNDEIEILRHALCDDEAIGLMRVKLIGDAAMATAEGPSQLFVCGNKRWISHLTWRLPNNQSTCWFPLTV